MKIIITAGGTGGHIMPALAIANAIRERLPDAEILFVGTDRGMEERLARQQGLEFKAIRALGIKGKSAANALRSFAVNMRAFLAALRIVRTYRPQWVIGTGGYVTGMVVLAGYFLGCRLAIQEQNSVAGLTNRILSRIVEKIFIAFPDSRHVFPQRKTVLTGNPVRKEIAQRRGAGDKLLVLGGSLGASSINHACTGALALLHGEGAAPAGIHQTGRADFSRVKEAYKDLGLDVAVSDFIDDMAGVYEQACLAVCRCGGLTLSELSRTGVPAIMVPYPHATDNHQMENARYVASKGGGWIIPDDCLTPERLALEIRSRLSDSQGLETAASNISAMCLGDGAEKIAREITGV